ncbi:hypothetical protein WA026_019213, partial [Henosepilachna vigintioctopunctata]
FNPYSHVQLRRNCEFISLFNLPCTQNSHLRYPQATAISFTPPTSLQSPRLRDSEW